MRALSIRREKFFSKHWPGGGSGKPGGHTHTNFPLNKHSGFLKKGLTCSGDGITILFMKKTPTIPTADSLSLYRDHSLLTPQTPELLDFYISLISQHHLPLHTMFDEDARRCQQHLPPLYFPSTYSKSIPPWGIVYYFWRRDGDSSFLDTLSEVEEEVLSTTHLDESLSTEDLSAHKLATSKYSLIKAHYSNPSKSTSLRNRKTQATLSHLSNESIKELIQALTAPTPQAAHTTPQATTPPAQAIQTPQIITIHEEDL